MHNFLRFIVFLTGMAFGFMLISLLLTACRTCECYPTIEYKDSIVVRYQHDTIQTYEKDSIYIHARGDTVYRERWSIRYRDKIVERHDTIYQDRNAEVVRVERIVPTYYKGVSLAFWVLVVLLVVATAVRILIRVYLKK